MNHRALCLFLTLLFVAISVNYQTARSGPKTPDELAPTPQQDTKPVEEVLRSFVDSFRSDRFASTERSFAIRVPGHGEWTVEVEGVKQDGQWRVTLRSGMPGRPTFGYRIEPETLLAIDAGTINAMTAQGKAFADDSTPMSIFHMEGYQPTLADVGDINPFSFHFWTRGFPETISFRETTTRKGHGSNFGVFYYEPGLRTGWYRVLPGERVHDGPREKAMPFHMLAIATDGTTEGEIDGVPVSLSAGNAVGPSGIIVGRARVHRSKRRSRS
ncbi:MAG: hypothetical protein AAFX06_30130 [Planctomycetota bacterium]